LHALVAELGIADDVVFVGGVPLEETARFYQAADLLVYPLSTKLSASRSSRPWRALPRGHLRPQRDARDRRWGAVLADPTIRGRSVAPSSMPPPPERMDCEHGPPSGPGVHVGCHRGRDAGRLSRGCRATTHAAMRVLVTGGAGFIGSHTADRLLELGHESSSSTRSRLRSIEERRLPT